MIKIGKYEFLEESQADGKIDALPENHAHAIIKLGNVIKEFAEFDEQGIQITPSVLS